MRPGVEFPKITNQVCSASLRRLLWPPPASFCMTSRNPARDRHTLSVPFLIYLEHFFSQLSCFLMNSKIVVAADVCWRRLYRLSSSLLFDTAPSAMGFCFIAVLAQEPGGIMGSNTRHFSFIVLSGGHAT